MKAKNATIGRFRSLCVGLVCWGMWATAAWAAGGQMLVGRVVAVSDGDTITLLVDGHEQHKVRIGGIDAPEKAQPYGQRSKQSLSDLVMHQNVVADAHKRDRYGRWVATVRSGATDAGLHQIQRGMAWHYKAYEKEQALSERLAYAAAQEVARSQRAGLWASPEPPVPPWDYRKARRQ